MLYISVFLALNFALQPPNDLHTQEFHRQKATVRENDPSNGTVQRWLEPLSNYKAWYATSMHLNCLRLVEELMILQETKNKETIYCMLIISWIEIFAPVWMDSGISLQ